MELIEMIWAIVIGFSILTLTDIVEDYFKFKSYDYTYKINQKDEQIEYLKERLRKYEE